MNFQTLNDLLNFLYLFNKDDSFPRNIYQFKKEINYCKTNENIKKYYVCNICNLINKTQICDKCKSKLKDYFIYNSIISLINEKLNEKYFFENLKKYKKKINSTNYLGDINTSTKYKKYFNENTIAYCMNCDGITIKKNNLIVIFIQILDIDSSNRYKKENVLLPMIFFKKEKFKFNFNLVTQILFEELKYLQNIGIKIFEEIYFFKIYTIIADLPARCKMLDCIQFNGYNSCNFCNITGKHDGKKIIFPNLINTERISDTKTNNFKKYLNINLNKDNCY